MLFKLDVSNTGNVFKVSFSELNEPTEEVLYQGLSRAKAIGEYERIIKDLGNSHFKPIIVGIGECPYTILDSNTENMNKILKVGL